MSFDISYLLGRTIALSEALKVRDYLEVLGDAEATSVAPDEAATLGTDRRVDADHHHPAQRGPGRAYDLLSVLVETMRCCGSSTPIR
jgi:hypothetical protein